MSGSTTVAVMTHHVIHGGKAAAAGRAIRKIIAELKKALGEHWPAWLDSPLGQSVAPIIIIGIAREISERHGSHLPAGLGDKLMRVCELGGESAGYEAMGALIDHLGPVLKEIQAIELPEDEMEAIAEHELPRQRLVADKKKQRERQRRRLEASKRTADQAVAHTVPSGNHGTGA